MREPRVEHRLRLHAQRGRDHHHAHGARPLDNLREHRFVRRVDRTAPTFSLTGAVKPDVTLGAGSHALVVDGRDVGAGGAENSGVKTFRAWIDGALQTQTATCASGACPKTFTIDTTASGLAEGPHTIAVEVEDGVALKSVKQMFTINVDRTGPEFLGTTGFLEHRPTSWGGQDLRVDVKDFAGSVAGVNQVKGSSFEGDLPEGSYVKQAVGTSVTGEVPAVHGTSVAKLVAAAGTDYVELGTDAARVPVTPANGSRCRLTCARRSPGARSRSRCASRATPPTSPAGRSHHRRRRWPRRAGPGSAGPCRCPTGAGTRPGASVSRA